MAKNKAYVVWTGRTPGVYKTWAECEAQVKGFPSAKFKGYPSEDAAHEAFGGMPATGSTPKGAHQKSKNPSSGKPTGTYLTVDAAFSQKTKILEWRGVLVENGNQTEVFRSNPYRGGSANVGEFLAIIDGLEYLSAKGLKMPIYSDSFNAQTWVKKKAHNSNVESSPNLIAMLDRANKLLRGGLYDSLKSGIPMKDWITKKWGEIPADFDRKNGKGLAVAEGPVL